jgi:hypothetical protein
LQNVFIFIEIAVDKYRPIFKRQNDLILQLIIVVGDLYFLIHAFYYKI